MNCLVIVCDALHLGFVGCYGSEWVQTPQLDRLADDGFVFDRCFPNRPSPGGWRQNGLTGVWEPRKPAPARPSLLDIARQSGFRVYDAASGSPDTSNKRSLLGRWLGSGQSEPMATLDELRHHPEYFVPEPDVSGFDAWTARWRRQLAREQRHPEAASDVERLFDDAAGWLDEQAADAPKFMWLEADLYGANPASTPWLPPASFQEMYLDEEVAAPLRDPMPGMLGDTVLDEDLLRVQAGYAAKVSFLDELIGGLIERLKPQWDQWTILIAADQGLPLGEHGIIGNFRPHLYEERSHVPFIIRDPDGRKCSRSPSLIQSVDLHPTLAELLNLDVPPSQGRSLLPILRGESAPRREYVCSGLEDAEYAIRTVYWSMLLPVARTDDDRRREMYAKPEDRWDTNNVEELNREVANHLELQLRRHLDAIERGTLDRLDPLEEDLVLSDESTSA